MQNDPIVNEIRQFRREHTEKFGGNLHLICEDLRRQERESGRNFVSYPPRPALDVTVSGHAHKNGNK